MTQTLWARSKTIWTSRTFWFNVLTVLVAVATHFGYTPNDVLTNNVESVLTNPFFIGLANILLRWITSKPVTLTQQPQNITIDSLPQ